LQLKQSNFYIKNIFEPLTFEKKGNSFFLIKTNIITQKINMSISKSFRVVIQNILTAITVSFVALSLGAVFGIFALVEMILFQDVIGLVPRAVFTGILLKVGYDVFDWTPTRLYFKEFSMKKFNIFHKLLYRHDNEL
jgi:SulP family sulfate permease